MGPDVYSALAELDEESRRRFLSEVAPWEANEGSAPPMAAPTPPPLVSAVPGASASKGTGGGPRPVIQGDGPKVPGTAEAEEADLMRRFMEAQQRGNARDSVNRWASGVGQDVANFVNGGSYGRGVYRNSIERDTSLRTQPVDDLRAQEAAKAGLEAQRRKGEADARDAEGDKARVEKMKADTQRATVTAAEDEALSRLDSPETNAARKAAKDLLMGRISDEALAEMNGHQLLAYTKAGSSQINAEVMAGYKSDAQALDRERFETETELRRANIALEAKKLAAQAEQLAKTDAAKKFDNEKALRGEVTGNQVVKEYQLAAVGLDKVRNAAQAIRAANAARREPTPADDIALIFGYMKTIDPTSVVRETEFATAQNAAGVPDRIRNAFNQAMNGQRLNATQREEFIRSAESQFTAYETRAIAVIDGYRALATQNGVDPGRVIPSGMVVSNNAPPPNPDITRPSGAPKGGTKSGGPTDGAVVTQRPGNKHRPLNLGAPPFTLPVRPNVSEGSILMYNPQGEAYPVKGDFIEKARAKGWKDVE